jgi:predicted nucleic acid-binding protein
MTYRSYVIDSSVIVKWINAEGEMLLKQSDLLLEHTKQRSLTLHAPHLAHYEVGNAILRKSFLLPEKIACLENLFTLPIQYTALSSEDAIRSLEVAARHHITFYDAVFIQLSIRLACPLITDNVKHQMKVKEAVIIPLKNYR